MRSTIRKLIVGRGQRADHERRSTIAHRWENVQAIWNNTFEEDAGLEKLVRLALACSQFLFPGMYVKHLFWRMGPLYQDLAMELFVLLKTIFPIVVLQQGWHTDPWVLGITIWLMLETVLYIPTLIFASDVFASPRSYRRTTLLLFLNYIEVVLSFAVVYASRPMLNKPFTDWTEAVYFSMVTSNTIGFGDIYPLTPAGRLLVILQTLFYLSYIVLVINFFSFRLARGYFRRDQGGGA